MNLLPYNSFFQNFKTLKFLFDLVFHQVHPMNMFFHVFFVQKVWNQLYDFKVDASYNDSKTVRILVPKVHINGNINYNGKNVKNQCWVGSMWWLINL
jgi:hypothetical protein